MTTQQQCACAVEAAKYGVANFNLTEYQPYDWCTRTCYLHQPPTAAAPPSAPPGAPQGAPPAGQGTAGQPQDFTNNELGNTGGFAPRLVLNITPPHIAANAILAGSNLCLEQPVEPNDWDENGNVKSYASIAVRVRKDRVRAWTRQDNSPVVGKDGEQVFSVECTLVHRAPELNDFEVEIASGGAAIVKAMAAVPDGMVVNVVRLPDVGRMRQYRIVQAL